MRPRSAIGAFPLILFLLLAGPWPGGTASADPVEGKPSLSQIEIMMAQWREPEAARWIKVLEKGGMKGARFSRIKGEILFLQGDYVGALRALNASERAHPGSPRVGMLKERVEAVRALVKGYKLHRSPGGHFIILTPPGKDELLAPFAAETLEAMRRALKEDLGYAPADPIRVEVYPSADALAKVSALTIEDISRTGTIALCKFNRLMIVTPRSLLRGYGWRDTLAHEYVHLVVSRVSHNNVPIWLHEGLAKYFELRWRSAAGEGLLLEPSQEHLLAEALRKGKLITWDQMHPSMAKLPDQRSATIAFAQVQTAVDFLVRRVKRTGLRRLLALIRSNGGGVWKALTMVSSLPKERFTAEWKRYLRTLNLRLLSGYKQPEFKLSKAPSKEQRRQGLRQKKARDYLRLADLLRSRRRTRAAIVEYKKARELLGLREEFVANHLARAYLEISSPVQAIAALMPVLEYYPELPGPQVTMGLAYLRKGGDMGAAVRHLKAGLRLNPFNPEVHCGLAQALEEIDSQQAALHVKICKQLSRQ